MPRHVVRGSADRTNAYPLQYYYVDNTDLFIEATLEDFGVTVDSYLKSHSHMSVTVKKVLALANNLLKSSL